MSAMHGGPVPAAYRTNGLHWAKRPLPEPPRTRRVSKWTRVPLDPLQEQLEEWLREQSVSGTYDGD